METDTWIHCNSSTMKLWNSTTKSPSFSLHLAWPAFSWCKTKRSTVAQFRAGNENVPTGRVQFYKCRDSKQDVKRILDTNLQQSLEKPQKRNLSHVYWAWTGDLSRCNPPLIQWTLGQAPAPPRYSRRMDVYREHQVLMGYMKRVMDCKVNRAKLHIKIY